MRITIPPTKDRGDLPSRRPDCCKLTTSRARRLDFRVTELQLDLHDGSLRESYGSFTTLIVSGSDRRHYLLSLAVRRGDLRVDRLPLGLYSVEFALGNRTPPRENWPDALFPC